ncbi:TPA: Spaf_1101 family AAA-like ATPase [Streptococcus suis]
MRGFNNKIKSVYQELTNTKEKFGSFHKTLIHLHTPTSHDYKLFSDWNVERYRNASDEELYNLFFNNKQILKDKFPMEQLISSIDNEMYSDFKEYISFLFLAEQILVNDFEIVVVTDHNTTDGVAKLRDAIDMLKRDNHKYKYHPHVYYGVEVSAADKLHIVGIFDDEKKQIVDDWLKDNLLSQSEGSYQHSLTIMKFFNDNKIINYIAHFNTSNIFTQEAQLSGAYKKSLLTSSQIKFMGVNKKEAIKKLLDKLSREYYCNPNFILDNDAHDIDTLNKNIMWFKGGKISFRMFEETLLDFEVSVSIEPPRPDKGLYIKGLYIENRKENRSFLTNKSKEKDFSLTFSPSLNCLIGGRGTGKSTIIDMLQYALAQRCDRKSKLEFLCEHANIYILYIMNQVEYIIEVSLPDIKQGHKDDILQYFGQNIMERYEYRYRYDSNKIQQWALAHHTKIYKVCNLEFEKVDNKDLLLKMFDKRYSVNELVRTADGSEITRFISELILSNQHLPTPNFIQQTRTLSGLVKKLPELKEFREGRQAKIFNVVEAFNSTQKNKLRIVYIQDENWGELVFEKTLFGWTNNLGTSFKGFRISKQNVIDFLEYTYNKLGFIDFVTSINKGSIPEKYFRILEIASEDNITKHRDAWEEKKEVDKESKNELLSQIYSLMRNYPIDEFKRIVQNYATNEKFFLEFNVNAKETSRQLKAVYKDVSILSLGQKVVAMLDFILAYSDYSNDFRPLIIDQPEDNLDNRYIYGHLVQQFRNIKTQRQIILATHNATIVTNSMTDQVVIMESDGVNGWVEAQGYVSEKSIKNHIINQLEGGKDSFRHKMSIYETVLSK